MSRHAREAVLPHLGSYLTLKRVMAILAAALDEGRTRGLVHRSSPKGVLTKGVFVSGCCLLGVLALCWRCFGVGFAFLGWRSLRARIACSAAVAMIA